MVSQPRTRLQVIVCDDHRTLREALAAYLFAQPDIAAVHAVGDADEAIRLARGGGDVLLLDLSLGGDVTGLDVLEALHNLHIRVPVLVMTATDDLDLLAKALALGALGFCHKSVHPDVLYRAVLSVAEG